MKTYAKIQFTNCCLDYDYTICEFNDVRYQLEAVEYIFTGYELLDTLEDDFTPRVLITPVIMDEENYNELQKQWSQ